MRNERTLRQCIDARMSGLELTPGMQSRILRLAQEQEEPMKKKLSVSMIVIAALMLALLASACAAAIRFGMADFKKEQQDNAVYQEHVLSLNETYQNDYLTFSLNDAVFDGTTLSLAMDIEQQEDAPTPVLVWPSFAAECGGRELAVEDCGGMGKGAYLDGFFVPSFGEYHVDSRWGIDLMLRSEEDRAWANDPANGPITWKLSMRIYKPEWPISVCEDSLNDDGDATEEEIERYQRKAVEAYQNQRLLLNEYGELSNAVYDFPAPEGVSPERWRTLNLAECLVEMGAFTLVDSPSIVFTTEQVGAHAKFLAEPQTFDVGDCTVTVTKLDVTFASIDYALEVRKKQGNANVDYLSGGGIYEFAVLAEGATTCYMGSGMGVQTKEGGLAYTDAYGTDYELDDCLLYSGTLTVDGPTDRITFVPCFTLSRWGDNKDFYAVMREQKIPSPELEAHSFTVELSK